MKTRECGHRLSGKVPGPLALALGTHGGSWKAPGVGYGMIWARGPRTHLCASTPAAETFYGVLGGLEMQDN